MNVCCLVFIGFDKTSKQQNGSVGFVLNPTEDQRMHGVVIVSSASQFDLSLKDDLKLLNRFKTKVLAQRKHSPGPSSLSPLPSPLPLAPSDWLSLCMI